MLLEYVLAIELGLAVFALEWSKRRKRVRNYFINDKMLAI